MKSIKRTLPVVALILLAGGVFAVSEAEARGCPMMNGSHKMHNCPMMGQGGKHHEAQSSSISDAQRKEARALVDTAQDKIAPLKQQLFIKEQELQALHNASTPDVAAVSKKATEIVELRQQIANERKALGQAIDKVLGLEAGTHSL